MIYHNQTGKISYLFNIAFLIFCNGELKKINVYILIRSLEKKINKNKIFYKFYMSNVNKIKKEE